MSTREVTVVSSASLRASGNLLNPSAPPIGRLEGIGKILRLMNHLAVAKLHDAYGVSRSPFIGDRVFGNPEIAFSLNSLDVEPRRFIRMMAPEGLQIISPDNPLAHYQLGRVLERKGKREEASVHLKRAAELDPHYR